MAMCYSRQKLQTQFGPAVNIQRLNTGSSSDHQTSCALVLATEFASRIGR